MTAFLSALGGLGELIKLLAAAFGWYQSEQQKQTGEKLQQGADAEASLKAQQAVDQIAQKPVTQTDVDKALSPGGTF